MPTPPSLFGRATLALVLMIGFYALAVGIAGGLLYFPYAEWHFGHRLHLKAAFGCVVGAGLVLFSIVPRPDRFQPPGPRLDPDKQPRLFRVLQGIAATTGQSMPKEVYLLADMNAWVSARGGIMGFGSRRVMGLGLPLMQVLTTAQFRAVLAHEFGHYHGGDTKLGPWIYKTRSAIGRTITNLAEAGSVLQKPFLWYGSMFLRITHAISRRQEYTADALAARTVGARPLAEGLRTVHGAALAYDGYWSNEVVPVLQSGHRPPMAPGFGTYVGLTSIADAIHRAVEHEIAERQSDPYDTHPSLRERLAALGKLPTDDDDDGAMAITLLENVDSLERRLVASIAGPEAAAKLRPIDWDRVGDQVYLPAWRRRAAASAAHLSGMTPVTIPTTNEALEAFGRRVHGDGDDSDSEAQAVRANGTIGAAFATALADDGWQVVASVGEPISLTRGEERIEPFSIAPDLASGDLDPEAWRARCRNAGIADLALDTPACGEGDGSTATELEPRNDGDAA
jgi:heat shock protein HtpX